MQYRTSEDFCKHVWLCLVLMVVACRSTPPPPPTPTPPPLPIGQIAFISRRDGNFEIYLMESDGSNPINLTKNPANDRAPSWSPDGKQLVFSSNRDGKSQLYILDIQTNAVRHLRTDPDSPKGPAWLPSPGGAEWSPDGEWIVYSSTTTHGEVNIFKIRPDGGEKVQLTPRWLEGTWLTWSPDGRQIAFIAWPRMEVQTILHEKQNLYIMDSDGANVHQLTNDTYPIQNKDPDWNPDGVWLAYTSSVAKYNRDTIVLRNLVTGETQTPLQSLSEELWYLPSSPDWSPDGQWLAFDGLLRKEAQNGDICFLHVASGYLHCLFDNQTNDGFPRWRPLAHP